MNMNIRICALTLLAAMFFLPGISAAATTMRMDATNAAEFDQQAAELRAQSGYADMSLTDRQEVDSSLQRLQKLFNKLAAGKTLSSNDQVSLTNAESQINAIMSGKPGDRIVCEHVKKLGSNRSERVCQTVAERDAARSDSQQTLRSQQHARGGSYDGQ